ncbi:MAG: LapA family protein [Burkholderiaceae bacterium]|jgi:uncharacterized integral membrane protein|nr:LapA family protein [Burkholderiaceae bacterium]
MSLRSLPLIVVGFAIVLFVGGNWSVMVQPTDLSLIFAEVHAPLGLVLLGFIVLISVLFTGFVAYMQGTVLLENRRHAKELAAQRELADKAEASRFTDLRAHLEQQQASLIATLQEQTEKLMARVDRAETGLRERPIDANIGLLVSTVQEINRQLQARLDRMETGIGDRLAYVARQSPAPAAPRYIAPVLGADVSDAIAAAPMLPPDVPAGPGSLR